MDHSYYSPKNIENKWQDFWEQEKIFHFDEKSGKEKKYILDMFPYPSAAGLHVGHPEGYTATDILSRYFHMNGWNVLHPMGWDAFGLPTENFAIKVGKSPKVVAARNIENFRRQIKSLGFSYDWSREIDTSSPEYYRWTQWLFLKLYERGLAYKASAKVNWCDSCKTVLANEQVTDGRCERCKNTVIQKDMEQWFFRVTAYAEELLASLDDLDWPDQIKQMQKHWIGKSEGAQFLFPVVDHEYGIEVFSTRPDTLFGVTSLVLAPEHPLVAKITGDEQKPEVERYLHATKEKSELQRTHLNQEKNGVFLGAYAKHPASGKRIPIWIADYVVMTYGTGAIMSVPAHDERDYAFAKKYDLPIVEVIQPDDAKGGELPFTGSGTLMQSDIYDGLKSHEAGEKIIEAFGGKEQVRYKLRDWLVSRQRYWGAPIPMISCASCGLVPVPYDELPVLLPDDVDFRPTGKPPLEMSVSFHRVACPKCGEPARRESETLDTFVCSSWYFLRYVDPSNDKKPFDEKKVKKVLPVDLYVGGAEHAVLHLLYSRFITKVLHDDGLLTFDEPFAKLRNQGLILGEDGVKMSKSRGNVINPDEIVDAYGADTLRLYEMFMGPLSASKPWSAKGILGPRRFLENVWNLSEKIVDGDVADLDSLVHGTLKKVTSDIEKMSFNTAISAMMILANEMKTQSQVSKKHYETLLLMLSPFAPHISEELWKKTGHDRSTAYETWPEYDEKKIRITHITIAVQVNGKVRDTLTLPADISEEQAFDAAVASMKIQKYLTGKTVRKKIYVRNKLISLVVS